MLQHQQKDVIRTHEDVIRSQLAKQQQHHHHVSNALSNVPTATPDILTKFWEHGIRDKVMHTQPTPRL